MIEAMPQQVIAILHDPVSPGIGYLPHITFYIQLNKGSPEFFQAQRIISIMHQVENGPAHGIQIHGCGSV